MPVPMASLKDEDCEYLLRLSNGELQQWLAQLPKARRGPVERQLLDYRSPQERAEQSLYEFVQQAWHIVEPDWDFLPGWHIEAICQHLEATCAGTIRNLLINLPPGHCKSRVCNVFFPAWVFTRNPAARFFHASYAQELATRDSVDCRYIIESDWYRERWGDKVRLVDDQNQKIKFGTTAHGWRMATSVGGRGTGEHPDFIIIDDPHNVRQAESEAERHDCLKWWDSTISSRGLIRGVRKVVIMQRLHVSDLSGHILDRGGFDHICLPYRYEPGRMAPTSIGWTDPRQESDELLWPQIPAEMQQTFDDFAPRINAGQLQQRPVPEGGAMFRREWFKIVPAAPAEARVAVRYWDKAASADAGDYSAGVLMVSHEGLWYVADVVHGRWSIRERNQIILQTAQMDSLLFPELTTVVEQEGGSGGKESAQFTVRQLAGFHVQVDKVTGAKELRAQPFADQCEAGNVRVVRGTWNHRFVEELCVFPAGDHDDQVDAASGAFSWCARIPAFEAPTSYRTTFDPRRHGVQIDLSQSWRNAWRAARN
jgi:predicted phage terminase large subunit-like protein